MRQVFAGSTRLSHPTDVGYHNDHKTKLHKRLQHILKITEISLSTFLTHVWGEGFQWGNLRERNHLGYLDVDGIMIVCFLHRAL